MNKLESAVDFLKLTLIDEVKDVCSWRNMNFENTRVLVMYSDGEKCYVKVDKNKPVIAPFELNVEDFIRCIDPPPPEIVNVIDEDVAEKWRQEDVRQFEQQQIKATKDSLEDEQLPEDDLMKFMEDNPNNPY